MPEIRYRIYPTLLNSFLYYEQQIQSADGSVLVAFQDLIDRINRVKKPATVAQQRGIDFESALLTGEGEEVFPQPILSEMRRKLPPKYRTQVYVKAVVRGDIEVYGLVDVLGGNRAIDIKTTARYEAPKFAFNPQNLYLLGLHPWGVEQLDYLITDFNGVYVETYRYDTYDFEPLLSGLERFAGFLETNQPLITDKRVLKMPTEKTRRKRGTDGIQTSLF
ncbi:MAG: hypothetical protein LH606_04760 [Cytophagaceae bacterium]|nr:hypothetical protein [Cytophagaceae bacterium]